MGDGLFELILGHLGADEIIQPAFLGPYGIRDAEMIKSCGCESTTIRVDGFDVASRQGDHADIVLLAVYRV